MNGIKDKPWWRTFWQNLFLDYILFSIDTGLSEMYSSQIRTAPLVTTNSIFVPPITGKGPPFRCSLCTDEAPQLFMLIGGHSISSFSSDPVLGLEASDRQALCAKFDIEFGGVGKGDRRGRNHTPVARTKDSPGTLKAASDVRTIAFDIVQKCSLDDYNESSEYSFIRCKTTDKNTISEDYTQGQEGHHPQSPSPSSGDAVLSCWETGAQFSYHGCDLGVFGPTPCQRGFLTIPDREHDPIVHHFGQRIQNHCYAPLIRNKVLTPDPLDIPQIQLRGVEDLEEVTDRSVTGVPAGSLLFSV
ncbi:hypothetical protein F5876DRAFT_75788 [Lentinula aff. lateritia]|uniref:Uncharacterized protein n=1 Tax=Lentinula aff. lateritia TaxID=2804960 RepID=A0ACC1U437_9AGAR|nr:hypothetical protein F5876DRAFT_75788 [Lentinula aff. lateritia]